MGKVIMSKKSLGIDPETGAEKFEVRNDEGVLIGYDLVYTEE
jgi:hypothetical protein